jgi:hypothetical protein
MEILQIAHSSPTNVISWFLNWDFLASYICFKKEGKQKGLGSNSERI